MRLKRRLLVGLLVPLVVLELIIVATIFAPVPVHAAAVGTVCIAPGSGTTVNTTGCPPVPVGIIVGTAVGATCATAGACFTVNVNVQGSQAYVGFEIYVKTNPTLIEAATNTTTDVIVGTLLDTPLTNTLCINGHAVSGGCTTGLDGNGIVHLSVTSSSFTLTSANGVLFSIIYRVKSLATTTGSPIVYQTGCSSPSNPQSNDNQCVVLVNGGTSPTPENVATGTWVGPLVTYLLGATPAALSMDVGGVQTSTINGTSYHSLAATVAMAATDTNTTTGKPTVTLSSASIVFTSRIATVLDTLTITVPSTAPPGNYLINVTGTVTGQPVRFVIVTVTVLPANFIITSNPNIVNQLNAGATGISVITLTSQNNFTGTVGLTATPQSGLTATLTLPSLLLKGSHTGTSTNSTNLSVSSTVAGTYTVTVTATQGSISHTAQILVRVVDFTISSSQNSLIVKVGASNSSLITIGALNSIAGTVNFTQSSASNTGLTLKYNTTGIIASGAANLTITASNTIPGGTYTVTAKGNSTSLVHSVTITVTVPGGGVLPTLVSVVTGTDGNLYWSGLTTGWAAWQPLNGHSPSAPSLCASGPSSTELVVQGSDSGVYHKTFSGGAWSATWDRNPIGITIGQPVCAVIGTTLYVVVRGASGELWFTTEALSTLTWAASWTDLQGSSPSTPALAATPSLTRLDLVVRGTDNQIYHKAFTSGTWAATWDTSNRQPVADKTIGTPAIVSDGTQLHVVVIGSEGNLYYATLSFAGVWSTYQSLAGSTFATPVLVIDSANTLHLVVTGTDHAVYDKAKPSGGSWDATWTSAGGIVSGTPAVTTIGTTVRIVVQGADARLWYNTLSGTTWSGYVNMNGAASLAPGLSTP